MIYERQTGNTFMNNLQIPTNVPIALFPVRLETRFVTHKDGSRELLIRIYPDDVTTTTHEEALTDSEVEDAQYFWETYHGNHSQETIESTWNQLAGAYGLPRATYIVRQMRPISVEPLDFPSSATKSEEWTQPPRARLLPTRWRVLGYQGGNEVFNTESHYVVTDLSVGPSPDNPNITNPNAEAHWLVSFQNAIDVGMAIRVPESSAWNYDSGLDKLIVFGVREEGQTTITRDALSTHLEHRFFENAFEFVKVGTPTNHTEGVRVGDDPDARLRYFDIATRDSLDFEGHKDIETNTEKMRRSLGLEGIAAHPMAHLRGAQSREHDNVSIIHQILWPSTWGYYLENVLQLSREVSGFDEAGNWTSRGAGNMEELHWRYLRPDGPLATLRVGDQPYGVLPTTSLDGWKSFVRSTPEGDVPIGPSARTVNLLRDIRDHMFRPQISAVPRLGNGTQLHKDFIKVLQQTPRSQRLNLRGVVTQTAYMELARTLRWPSQSMANASALETNIEGLLDNKYGLFGTHNNDAELDFRPEADYSANPQKNEPRLARLMPLCVSRRDFEPVIVQVKPEQLNTDSFRLPEYLSWLADASYTEIIDDADGWMTTAENGEPLPLFALLARHSCIQVLYSTALKFLTRWEVKDNFGKPLEMEAFEPDIYNLPIWNSNTNSYDSPEISSESIWQWLNDPLAQIIERTDYDLKLPESMTLLDFLEQIRLEPIDLASDSELGQLFFYDLAQPYIRFWLNFFLYSKGTNRQKLEAWDYGRELHKKLAQISEQFHLQPFRIPYEYNPMAISVEDTERYVLSALSASSDRLDAWVTALATQRLDHLNGSGVGYGGFGYVENLKPNSSPPSAGYVHTPSVEQAHTAAVLKSAHLTYETDEDSSDNAATLNLSSARVRQAKELIAGVRQGQTLGALLGYQFERGLRERSNANLNLMKLIKRLRDVYPVRVTRMTSTNPDTPASRLVVDGLKIVRAEEVDLESMEASSSEAIAIRREIKRIRALVDAAENLLLAEAVHQIVQGNPNRALASLDAQNRAGVPPDQFDVVDTPRSGRSVTHRVIVLLDASQPAQPGTSARSKAAPRLNKWLEGILGLHQGAQAQVSCEVSYTTADATTVSYYITLDELLSASDFNVEAIDLLYMVPSSELGQQDVLDAYVRFIVSQKTGVNWPSRDVDKPVAINYASASSGHRTFQTFFDAVAMIKSVVSSARHLTGQDLDHPSRGASSELDFITLEQRVSTSVAALSTTTGLRAAIKNSLAIQEPATALQPYLDLIGVSSDADLTQFDSFIKLPQTADVGAIAQSLTLPNPADLETLLTLLFEASEYGIIIASPLSTSPSNTEDRPSLVTQACAVYREIERRVASMPDNTSSSAMREVDRAQVLFGEDFQPLPYIGTGNADYSNNELFTTLKASNSLLGDNTHAAFGWLGQVARVRSRVRDLQDALTLSDLVIPESTLSSAQGFTPIKVGQLPYEVTQSPSWIAISAPPEDSENPESIGNAVSFLVIDTDGAIGNPGPPTSDPKKLAGLIIDEWNEVIPSVEETTGVAFHYDRPATRPPQSVLLAVPPEVGGNSPAWTDEALVDIINETIEMAKIRGIDSATIADMAIGSKPGEMLQFLPALLFPDYGDANPPSVFVDFSSYL